MNAVLAPTLCMTRISSIWLRCSNVPMSWSHTGATVSLHTPVSPIGMSSIWSTTNAFIDLGCTIPPAGADVRRSGRGAGDVYWSTRNNMPLATYTVSIWMFSASSHHLWSLLPYPT